MAGILKQLNLSVRKRKKRISSFYRSSILTSPHLFASDDAKEDIDYQVYEIDDSSPIKKVKRAYSDNSQWFLAKCNRKKERRSSSLFNLAHHDDESFTNQLKKSIQAEKLQREGWLHSTTSKLKNKVKNSYQQRSVLTVRLGAFINRYSITVADGIVKDGNSDFEPSQIIKIMFPSALASSMGLANGTIINLYSPWKVSEIDSTKYIINPFWINVIDRSQEKFIEPTEETILKCSCPCRESLGEIEAINCGVSLSQKSTELSQI